MWLDPYPHLSGYFICLTGYKWARKWSSAENAPKIWDALETAILKEIKEQLVENVDGNGVSLRGTAPGQGEAVDQDVIMTEAVSARASFGTVVECFPRLEPAATACSAAGDSLYLGRAEQGILKVLNPKKKRLQSTLEEFY